MKPKNEKGKGCDGSSIYFLFFVFDFALLFAVFCFVLTSPLTSDL